MRLIDADELKIDYGFTWDDITPTHDELYALIDRQPTIEAVQERKGRWVELYDSNYKCSECGAWWHSDDMDINEEFRFCPSCGASMTEGADDARRNE